MTKKAMFNFEGFHPLETTNRPSNWIALLLSNFIDQI